MFQQEIMRCASQDETAALIVGLSLLMLIYHPPGWKEYAGWFFGFRHNGLLRHRAAVVHLAVAGQIGRIAQVYRPGKAISNKFRE